MSLESTETKKKLDLGSLVAVKVERLLDAAIHYSQAVFSLPPGKMEAYQGPADLFTLRNLLIMVQSNQNSILA